ncbi:MAG: hypothetical protein LBS82_00045 [Spirochaetaceae bacterium]|jgi:predicted ATP-dependent serine protease|nr:hypothetical protein [Spirochaetaceae bacterium]
MIKDELISRSPVRVFEKSITGGLQAGEIGLIASAAGIGKTSILVQIALDKLLQGKKIIHISFTQEHDYVVAWYQDIFDQIIKAKNVENERELKEDVNRNRMLLNFNQKGVNTDVIRKSLKAIIVDGGYKTDALIIDGFNFSIAKRERLATLREFSKELGLSVWYSCSVKDGDYDDKKVPNVIKDFEDCIDVVIDLEPKADHVGLSVVKDHGKSVTKNEPLRLDPKTLMMLE